MEKKPRTVNPNDKPVRSKTQRKKEFGKWVNMNWYHECEGHTWGYKPGGYTGESDVWKDEEVTIKCSKCSGVTGEMVKKNDKWYCYYCEEDIDSPIQEKHLNR